MRIILAGLICFTFIGGLAVYMNQRAAAVAVSGNFIQAQKVQGRYRLEITTTFAAEPDPFAIQLESENQAPALLVRLGSQEIIRKTENIESGIPIIINPFKGLVTGDNELWFEANPPIDAADKSQGVRIQIFKDNNPIIDRTFWSVSGGKVSNVVHFTLEASVEKEDKHGH